MPGYGFGFGFSLGARRASDEAPAPPATFRIQLEDDSSDVLLEVADYILLEEAP